MRRPGSCLAGEGGARNPFEGVGVPDGVLSRRPAGAGAEDPHKHGVSFEEAVTAFEDPLSLTIPDPEHSEDESRYVLLGMTHQNRLAAVVHTENGDIIRIVSARMGDAAGEKKL